MKVVENFEDLMKKSVAVVGVGGVGSIVCEMLTWTNIGKLIIFDYDKVEISNMNRMFYWLEQVDKYKVEAAKETL